LEVLELLLVSYTSINNYHSVFSPTCMRLAKGKRTFHIFIPFVQSIIQCSDSECLRTEACICCW